MSTYLELCQKTAKECGVAQGGTYPSSVSSQVGILGKIVNWVRDSWLEIQGRPVEWRWMRREFTIATTASLGIYDYTLVTDDDAAAVISRFSRWRFDDPETPAKCYLTSTGVGGQYYMSFLPWNYFKQIYRMGTQVEGQPYHISIDPRNNLVVGPVPDASYTIQGDFERGPQTLVSGTDTPDMPSQFHNLIMYEAMTKYGIDQSAPEVSNRGLNYSNMLMRQLEADQGEELMMAGPLA